VEGARGHGVEQAQTLRPAGTRYEQVLRTQQPDIEAAGDGARMIVPVTDRGDAIGLLELDLPRYPSADEVADICSAAHALAYVVIAARRHTDVSEWGQRSTPFALAAEIQRRLLPASYTCEAGQFTLAGWLEPASSVGGDTFDYTLDRDSLHVSITDAVGQARFANDSLRRTRCTGSSSPGSSCGSNCAPQLPRSSTPGTPCRCGCEPAESRRSR
jgi:hypothetical protein